MVNEAINRLQGLRMGAPVVDVQPNPFLKQGAPVTQTGQPREDPVTVGRMQENIMKLLDSSGIKPGYNPTGPVASPQPSPVDAQVWMKQNPVVLRMMMLKRLNALRNTKNPATPTGMQNPSGMGSIAIDPFSGMGRIAQPLLMGRPNTSTATMVQASPSTFYGSNTPPPPPPPGSAYSGSTTLGGEGGQKISTFSAPQFSVTRSLAPARR